MPDNTPPPPRVGLADALTQHLERAKVGQGRFYPQPDGEQEFACDMGDSPYGCAWCDTFAWPGGNPLDAE